MIPSTTFSFDESSAWDPKVIREQLCIPEDQLNILSNLPGWLKATDRANTYRLDKDTSTQQFQSSQSNFLATAQNSQKNSPVTPQNSQKDPPASIQNCEKDSPVSTQNCGKDSPQTIQICQKDLANIDLLDKHPQLYESGSKNQLKAIKVRTYQKTFAKSFSLSEIDKIGKNLPNNRFLKKSLSLPVLYQSFDNLCIKLCQNSDWETVSQEKSTLQKVLGHERSVIVDQKDTILTKSSSLSKANLEVMEVVAQLPEKIVGNLMNEVVDTMNIVSVALTTKSSDNLGIELTGVENRIATVNNEDSIICEGEHKDKPALESHANKLDSCVKEIIPTGVNQTIVTEQVNFISTKSVDLNSTPVLITELPKPVPNEQASKAEKMISNNENLQDAKIEPKGQKVSHEENSIENRIASVNNGDSIICENEHKDKPTVESHANKSDSCVKEIISTNSVDLNSTPVLITELPKPVHVEQASEAEKMISNNENLQDATIELKEQKVTHQENSNEANKPATENKCVQGKRKSEFKIKSSKKHKSARDVKPGNGDINEARNIRKAGEICYAEDDIITMINILKHYL